MFDDLYSMEADNDEIDVCMKSQVNNETAVTEAGTDTEATDVSNISEKTEAHNELASTGGVATGSDTADMEMDPVAATESYCFKRFSMSAEDIAAEVEENIKAANEILDADTEEDDIDPELEAVGMNNAGISTEDPADIIPDETPADNAGVTPDADESKDDGEGDADAPLNPIPPALPTSEEDWEFSLEGMPIYSLESLEKYRKVVEVLSIDEYFKNPSVKANLDKLIITLKNKKWKSLTKSGIKDLKKALFSKGIPNSEKIKSAKEKGINISVSDYKYKTLNTIIERCKIDNSDVATVVVCYDVGGKYKVHYFGDMMFVKKSKEDWEGETSEEDWEFSLEEFEQSLEKAGGYFKSKDFEIPKKERVKGGIDKKVFESGANFMNSSLGQSKIGELKAEFKKRGLTFATREDCKTQEVSLANRLVRAVYPSGNDNQIYGEQFWRNMSFIEKDGIIFAVTKNTKLFAKPKTRSNGMDQYFTVYALGKNKKGTIDAVLYAKIPSRTYAYIENIDSKSNENLITNTPYMDFV